MKKPTIKDIDITEYDFQVCEILAKGLEPQEALQALLDFNKSVKIIPFNKDNQTKAEKADDVKTVIQR